MDESQPSEVRLHPRVAEQERMEHAGRQSSEHDHDVPRSPFLGADRTLHAPTIPASASFSVSTLWRAAGGSATRRRKRRQKENGTVSAFERTFSTVPERRAADLLSGAALPLAAEGQLEDAARCLHVRTHLSNNPPSLSILCLSDLRTDQGRGTKTRFGLRRCPELSRIVGDGKLGTSNFTVSAAVSCKMD